ncbi:hypothetical protein EB796_022765 [Bugula neritina]|uniref:Uncharacterized protein n=1 Tax=Bugula neritina TaxID=10212 RepID=A0A7J7IZX5_BUGNE|nr:hypothetical protein EB796_022765 [Bugula neritina]
MIISHQESALPIRLGFVFCCKTGIMAFSSLSLFPIILDYSLLLFDLLSAIILHKRNIMYISVYNYLEVYCF